MPHAKFNWRTEAAGASGASNEDGTYSFLFGETWKLTNHTLGRPEGAKACTLDGA